MSYEEVREKRISFLCGPSIATQNSAQLKSESMRISFDIPQENKDNTYLYRYTSIESFKKMIDSGYMRLGHCYSMNDEFEIGVLEKHNINKKLFYTCFSKATESLAMYKLYGEREGTVAFKISISQLERIMRTNALCEEQKTHSFMHEFKVLSSNGDIGNSVKGKLFCTNVGYFERGTKEILCDSKVYGCIDNPFSVPDLAGKIKFRCWKYEKELRLCGQLQEDLGEQECIMLRLPSDFDKSIQMFLAPGFKMEKHKDELDYLSMKGIQCMESAYYSFYSEFVNKLPVPTYGGEFTIGK